MRSRANKILGLWALASLISAAHAEPIYSLASNGGWLIRFDSATPGAVTTLGVNVNGFLGFDIATFVGAIAANRIFGLAAAPAVATSEPGSLGLVAAAGLAMLGLRRRLTGA